MRVGFKSAEALRKKEAEAMKAVAKIDSEIKQKLADIEAETKKHHLGDKTLHKSIDKEIWDYTLVVSLQFMKVRAPCHNEKVVSGVQGKAM